MSARFSITLDEDGNLVHSLCELTPEHAGRLIDHLASAVDMLAEQYSIVTEWIDDEALEQVH